MGGAGASDGRQRTEDRDGRRREIGSGRGSGSGGQATGDRRLETFDAGVKSQPGGKTK